MCCMSRVVAAVFLLAAGPMTGCIGWLYPEDLVPLDKLILLHRSKLSHVPEELGYRYDNVTLPVAEGRWIKLWQVYSEPSKGLVIIVPGMDQNKGRYVPYLPIFVENGYDVILMDYEGYGESPGESTLSNLVDDTLAACRYARSRHEKVIAFGVSLGTPLVARAAAELDFDGCIFEGTLILGEEATLWLTDLTGSVPPIVSALADGYVLRQMPEDYDIRTYITRVTEPKLFIHSAEDEVTPLVGARLVYDAAPEPKQFWEVRGGHCRMADLDRDLYTRTVIGWIDRQLGPGE